MKRKEIYVIIAMLLFYTVPVYAISVSAVGTTKLTVGQEGTISLKTSTQSSISGTVKVTSGNSVSLLDTGLVYKSSSNTFLIEDGATIKIKANSVGVSVITFVGVGDELLTGESFNVNQTIKIEVVENKPTTPNKPSTPNVPSKDNTEEEKKKPQMTEEQKKAAEEEKRKNELEAQKRIPLIKEVSIVSDSEKLNGEVLTKIALTDNTFSYSYSVPRRINSLKLSVPEVEGVTLKYDSNVTLAEDQEETNVVISATKGEISQEFTIVLKQDLSEEVTRTFSGIEHKVYKDELVDKYLSTLALSKEDTETQGHYYAIGDNAVQLLVDEENNAGFFLLDESKEIVEEVALVENTETSVLIAKQSKDTEERTISGIKQTLNENEKVVTLEDIDSSLVMSKNLQSWELEEGSVFLGIDNAKEESLFVIGQESGLSKVIVAFDKPVEGLDPLVVGLSVALGAVLFANAVFFGTSLYRKRKYNM